MKFSEETTLQKTSQVHWKSVSGEAVLLHFGSGNYFALDGIGTYLWSTLCVSPKKVSELIDALQLEYDCTAEQARSDTFEFCGQLLAERLLETKE